ncbi:MAG: hypothetical protein JWQ11_2066, partial [Rhizobacter sp.]|nr:hypothetical protein [Rhizobacter sp.]
EAEEGDAGGEATDGVAASLPSATAGASFESAPRTGALAASAGPAASATTPTSSPLAKPRPHVPSVIERVSDGAASVPADSTELTGPDMTMERQG